MNQTDYLEIEREFGSPSYIYDAHRIIENYIAFRDSFNVEDLKIHYACKALTNISVLKLFKQLGSGLDCVSLEEVRLGLHVGFKPEDIIFTPNGVSLDDYINAIELGVQVTVDNIFILEQLGIKLKDEAVFIRINPHINAGGNKKISVGNIDSKFGISIHQLPIVHRIVKNLNINVSGIHVHTGSDIIDTDIFERVASLIFSIADQFDSISSIDFGSGFKIAYHKNDLQTDINAVGSSFSTVFNDYCKKQNRTLSLRFEPGKYLVSDAGSFLVKVNSIKQSTACTFVGVNSGFNHLIRPMFYNAYHHIENISNPNGAKKLYSVVGNICETDTFAEDRILNEVREGDILVFSNAGAYCYSMASNYNSRLKPAEILWYNNKAHLIREREQFSDLLRNQVLVDLEI